MSKDYNPYTSIRISNPLHCFYLKEITMSNDQNFDINALLDGTLDDLADMPEFKPYPAGTHRVIIKLEFKKDVAGHPAYEVKLKAVETMELSNTADTPLAQGAETSVLYLMDNELGQGGFKKILRAAVDKFGAMKNSELIEASQNAEVAVVTKVRANKDKTKEYTDIVEIMFA